MANYIVPYTHTFDYNFELSEFEQVDLAELNGARDNLISLFSTSLEEVSRAQVVEVLSGVAVEIQGPREELELSENAQVGDMVYYLDVSKKSLFRAKILRALTDQERAAIDEEMNEEVQKLREIIEVLGKQPRN